MSSRYTVNERGRRRVNLVPGNGGATVLNFDSRGADVEPAEQQLARIDAALRSATEANRCSEGAFGR